eukprot:scaffold212704_cov32-Tisochrysis_lutea.AAC.1
MRRAPPWRSYYRLRNLGGCGQSRGGACCGCLGLCAPHLGALQVAWRAGRREQHESQVAGKPELDPVFFTAGISFSIIGTPTRV